MTIVALIVLLVIISKHLPEMCSPDACVPNVYDHLQSRVESFRELGVSADWRRTERGLVVSIASDIGKISLMRGRDNEFRVAAAAELLNLPWVKRVEIAAPNGAMGASGIDVIVETTDVGKLFLQVKSSRASASRFQNSARARQHCIQTVVGSPDIAICKERTRIALLRAREEVLAKRGDNVSDVR